MSFRPLICKRSNNDERSLTFGADRKADDDDDAGLHGAHRRRLAEHKVAQRDREADRQRTRNLIGEMHDRSTMASNVFLPLMCAADLVKAHFDKVQAEIARRDHADKRQRQREHLQRRRQLDLVRRDKFEPFDSARGAHE